MEKLATIDGLAGWAIDALFSLIILAFIVFLILNVFG